MGSGPQLRAGNSARLNRNSQSAKFVTGPLLRHILVMTGASGIGLMAIFLGDLANIYFLGLLGDQAIVAALGYASSITFLTISIGIGLAIAATALVSPALGAGHRVVARRHSVNAHVWTLVVASGLTAVIWWFIPELLTLLGAKGSTHAYALRYMQILVPSLPVLALAMTSAAVLRSVGDARRAMNVTLYGAITNVILDPIFIFGLDLGLEGAAMASALSRIVFLAIGLYGVIVVHDLMGRFRWRTFIDSGRLLASVAVPAIATNIATPAANAYVTAEISQFGDDAVAGWAIVGRIIPVAFGAIFSLSSAVGPIVGQNSGTQDAQRLREAFILSVFCAVAFTAIAWFGLALFSNSIVYAFNASGEAADLIGLFCYWLAPLFAFLGALFVVNAVFNTLRRPHYATALNWARTTVGTVPFAMIGGHLAGAEGVLSGYMLGGVPIGVLAVIMCRKFLDHVSAGWAKEAKQ